ncbi:unnamed protein product [Sphagnum jensenii]|uniref:Uncharacterized protein n=1 Tax=Sphagnum jensenii TaxID=128206 RepID=A0ABP1BED5_9BRYO
MHGLIDRSSGGTCTAEIFISFLVRFLMISNDEKDGDSGSTAKTKFKEPTLKQKHVVHDIVDMTSYIELHQQQKSNPVCLHPHQVRHCQDVQF